jgi:hypothetical protein
MFMFGHCIYLRGKRHYQINTIQGNKVLLLLANRWNRSTYFYTDEVLQNFNIKKKSQGNIIK